MLVSSVDNRADVMMRVPNKWLRPPSRFAAATSGNNSLFRQVKGLHERHHFGVKRTTELAREQSGDEVSTQLVKAVVSQCQQCARICPAVTVRPRRGKLTTTRVWARLACDITHVRGRSYLSIIDTSSRFAIWKIMHTESGTEVSKLLRQVFCEFGPPEELLSDN